MSVEFREAERARRINRDRIVEREVSKEREEDFRENEG